MSRRVFYMGYSKASYSYLLDDFPGAVKAHSFQLLRSAYAGRVQRARVSSSEQDILFDGNSQDDAQLLSFAGAGSAFMPLWANQALSGTDSTQTAATLQPRTVNGGVLETCAGYPALKFDGNDDWLAAQDLLSSIGGSNQQMTVVIVYRTGGRVGDELLGMASGNQTQSYLRIRDNGSGGIVIQRRAGSVNDNMPTISGGTPASNGLSMLTYDFDGTTHRGYQRDSLIGSQVFTGNFPQALTTARLGTRRDSAYFSGWMLEFVAWNSSQFAAGNLPAIQANIMHRYGMD